MEIQRTYLRSCIPRPRTKVFSNLDVLMQLTFCVIVSLCLLHCVALCCVVLHCVALCCVVLHRLAVLRSLISHHYFLLNCVLNSFFVYAVGLHTVSMLSYAFHVKLSAFLPSLYDPALSSRCSSMSYSDLSFQFPLLVHSFLSYNSLQCNALNLPFPLLHCPRLCL